jgi:hypothetical protein
MFEKVWRVNMPASISEIKNPKEQKYRSFGVYEQGYLALTTPPFIQIED